MKSVPVPAHNSIARRNLAAIHLRLREAEAALRAIRSGEVDTLVVAGKQGRQVFTLRGAEQPYRVLIESMNEGAVTLTADKMILYANRSFAQMVKCPLAQVIGSSFRRFFSTADRNVLRSCLQRSGTGGSKIQVGLHARNGAVMPVQISVRRAARNGPNPPTIGIVVTDLSKVKRSEERLRALTHRVVQVQEDERGRVALELHDGITQLLCAMVFRSQALLGNLPAHPRRAKRDAVKLREMAGGAVKEIERVSHNLRPSVLDQLGLVAALGDASSEFTTRTGVTVALACVAMTLRPTADGELTLYRILQEALRNVEKHAGAHHVKVDLTQPVGFMQLMIRDDGVGFDSTRPAAGLKGKGGLGLLSMRERATYVGGTVGVKSTRRGGTEIEVRIPLSSRIS